MTQPSYLDGSGNLRQGYGTHAGSVGDPDPTFQTIHEDIVAQVGASITGQTLEAGGSGNLGWLASIRKAITDRLPAALGQGTMAQSLSVTIASNQAAVPVSVGLPTTPYFGQTNVATAGTQVALASSQAILSGVTIKAKATNAGTILVGATGVTNSLTTGNGYPLAVGESVFVEVANLASIFLNATNSGDGVGYSAS